MKTHLKYIIGLAIIIPTVSTTVLLTLRFVENSPTPQRLSKQSKKNEPNLSALEIEPKKSKEELFLPIAKESILQILIDPMSAQFRNYKTDSIMFCIEVNSKNRLGGYVGFRWYTVTMFYNTSDGKSVDFFPTNYTPDKKVLAEEVSESSTQCKGR